MITVKIRETGETKELELIDQKTGCSWVVDFIGNTGAMNDGQFEYDEDNGVYLCDQGTFDWWDEIITKQDELDTRIAEMCEEYDFDTIMDIVWNATEAGTDLENEADYINQELDNFEAKFAGSCWMDEVLADSDEGWNDNYSEFKQALVNANDPAFPEFETDEETDAAYSGAWETLCKYLKEHAGC